MSEIKGAPCVQCAHFHGRVHDFRRCAPGVCTSFEPIIIATYTEGAWRNSRAHSFRKSAPNKTLISDTVYISVSEIKVLFGAHTGCTSPKIVHPGIFPCTLLICSYNNWLKKRAHAGCSPPKIVHPAVKTCTPSAGCTLNFGHCIYIYIYSVRN